MQAVSLVSVNVRHYLFRKSCTEWWEDNNREWTGLEFAKFQRAVEKREKWRKLVVKSSVVPRRPSRLRDR